MIILIKIGYFLACAYLIYMLYRAFMAYANNKYFVENSKKTELSQHERDALNKQHKMTFDGEVVYIKKHVKIAVVVIIVFLILKIYI